MEQVKVSVTQDARSPSVDSTHFDPSTSDSVPSRLRPLKADPPKRFAGTDAQRVGAHYWLLEARNWLELAGRGQDDATLVSLFATALEGPASRWLFDLRSRVERKGSPLTLQKVFDEFVLKFESGVSRVLLQQELNTLVYGKGKCRDIYATDAEFDRIVGQLFPYLDDSSDLMSLLADRYASIFEKGDIELWKEASRAFPATVDEWKAAIQKAYTFQQVVAQADRRLGRGTASATRHATSSSPSPPHRPPTVSVNEMQGRFGRDEERGETCTGSDRKESLRRSRSPSSCSRWL